MLAEVGAGADPEDPDDGKFQRLMDEIITPSVLPASRTHRTINAFTRQAQA